MKKNRINKTYRFLVWGYQTQEHKEYQRLLNFFDFEFKDKRLTLKRLNFINSKFDIPLIFYSKKEMDQYLKENHYYYLIVKKVYN